MGTSPITSWRLLSPQPPDGSIVLTAHTAPEIQRSARALGAEAFLPKPTPLPEIAATVHRLMGAAS